MYIWYIEKREPVRAVIPTDGVYMVHQEARSYTRAVIPTDDILIYIYNAEPCLGFFHRRNLLERESIYKKETIQENKKDKSKDFSR